MIQSRIVSISTHGHGDTIDLTSRLVEVLGESGINNGLVNVFVCGSTAAITTIEYDPNLVDDFKDLLERIASEKSVYKHNSTWGDRNGYAHLRASLLGPSLSVPCQDGVLALGTWQQIVLIDFDERPRQREIFIQIMGEKVSRKPS
jgi:secondary thiamine-phosphate synthase enzyme